MNVFVSFAAEDGDIAREISAQLTAEGHAVFCSNVSMTGGNGVHHLIREKLQDCDLFIFLISPYSIVPGHYCLSELRIIERRWPSPVGHVLPVDIRNSERASDATIPPYLKVAGIFSAVGDLTADVTAEVADKAKNMKDQMPSVKKKRAIEPEPHRNAQSFKGLPALKIGIGLLLGVLLLFTFLYVYHNPKIPSRPAALGIELLPEGVSFYAILLKAEKTEEDAVKHARDLHGWGYWNARAVQESGSPLWQVAVFFKTKQDAERAKPHVAKIVESNEPAGPRDLSRSPLIKKP